MISIYDYIVIGFYFIFMLVVGFAFRKFSKDISDYFRGGGTMLWWMSGASAFMMMFSAWVFTGAAGKAYEAGTIVLVLYFANALTGVFIYFFTSYRFRQMRVITHVEAIRKRYGRVNEQFYMWIQIPLAFFLGGIGLNAIGIFVSSVFGLNLITSMIILGGVVVFMSVTGGAWAVVASDFIQMLIVMSITCLAAFLALRLPEVGGLSGLIQKVPDAHFKWSLLARPEIIIFWIVGIVIMSFTSYNNIAEGASRFLTVKDGKHARKAALVSIVGMIIGPLIWIIPPMAATIVYPDIQSQFPNLSRPSEASYIAICMKTMPAGLIGLLICGVFAATMSSMDSALNRSAGVLIKNFYSPFIRPKASDKELLFTSKIVTCFFGLLVIGSAVALAKFRTLGLFDLVIAIAGPVGIPMIIPMVLGIFIKRVPSWAAWSTALVGFSVGIFLKYAMKPIWFQKLFDWQTELTKREFVDISFAFPVIAVTVITSAWYLFTTFFYNNSSKKYSDQVEDFFRDMNTPIDPVKENIQYNDQKQYRILGLLCMVYGAVIMILSLILNTFLGRICFIICGAVPCLTGLVLYYVYRTIVKRKRIQESIV